MFLLLISILCVVSCSVCRTACTRDEINIENSNFPVDYDTPTSLRDVVKVENYTFLVENGIFYLFEKSINSLVLKEYPAFYFPATQENGWKNFTHNTNIRNLNNQTIGFVIGHDKYYYPIVPRRNSIMYCGSYNLKSLLGNNKYITFHDLKFTHKDFIKNFIELSTLNFICFMYIYM